MGFSASRRLDFNLSSDSGIRRNATICQGDFLSNSEVRVNPLTPHHVGHNKYKLRPSILAGRKYYPELLACQNSDMKLRFYYLLL